MYVFKSLLHFEMIAAKVVVFPETAKSFASFLHERGFDAYHSAPIAKDFYMKTLLFGKKGLILHPKMIDIEDEDGYVFIYVRKKAFINFDGVIFTASFRCCQRK